MLAVLIGPEGVAPVVAALHDMDRNAGQHEPFVAGHNQDERHGGQAR